jgi:hypothetical protein
MSKIIKVENCRGCLYLVIKIIKNSEEGFHDLICKKMAMRLPDYPNIPDWCPLEDAK